MTQLETYLLNLFSGLIVALLTALVTVRLSLSRFRSERLWEHKLEAYLKIIEAIHKVKRYCKNFLGAEEIGAQFTKEFSAELGRDYLAAFAEIERAADTGLLLLAQSVIDDLAALQRVMSEMEADAPNTDAMTKTMQSADTCLARVRTAAKTDMRKSP